MADPLNDLSADLFRRRLQLTAVVLLGIGVVMNALGHALGIAWFRHWWQILPTYLGYVLPLTLWLRGTPTWRAWQRSVLVFIPLELVGYGLGTSVVGEHNPISSLLGPHNFTLAMVLLVSPIPLVANRLVDVALQALDNLGAPPSSMP
jgi:hypothetical protein